MFTGYSFPVCRSTYRCLTQLCPVDRLLQYGGGRCSSSFVARSLSLLQFSWMASNRPPVRVLSQLYSGRASPLPGVVVCCCNCNGHKERMGSGCFGAQRCEAELGGSSEGPEPRSILGSGWVHHFTLFCSQAPLSGFALALLSLIFEILVPLRALSGHSRVTSTSQNPEFPQQSSSTII